MATSLQSVDFNFAIMIGTQIGGLILSRNSQISPLLYRGIAFLIGGVAITVMSRKYIEK